LNHLYIAVYAAPLDRTNPSSSEFTSYLWFIGSEGNCEFEHTSGSKLQNWI